MDLAKVTFTASLVVELVFRSPIRGRVLPADISYANLQWKLQLEHDNGLTKALSRNASLAGSIVEACPGCQQDLGITPQSRARLSYQTRRTSVVFATRLMCTN